MVSRLGCFLFFPIGTPQERPGRPGTCAIVASRVTQESTSCKESSRTRPTDWELTQALTWYVDLPFYLTLPSIGDPRVKAETLLHIGHYSRHGACFSDLLFSGKQYRVASNLAVRHTMLRGHLLKMNSTALERMLNAVHRLNVFLLDNSHQRVKTTTAILANVLIVGNLFLVAQRPSPPHMQPNNTSYCQSRF